MRTMIAIAVAAGMASAASAQQSSQTATAEFMCQKQFGSFFSALVTAPAGGVEWIRDEPSYFQSSVNIDRGFCPKCGTPLTYRHPGGLEIAIGAFDDRSDLAPKIQVNYQSRLPWVETIFEQPVHEDPDYYGRQEQIISFQHPDHVEPPARGNAGRGAAEARA